MPFPDTPNIVLAPGICIPESSRESPMSYFKAAGLMFVILGGPIVAITNGLFIDVWPNVSNFTRSLAWSRRGTSSESRPAPECEPASPMPATRLPAPPW